MSGKPEDHGRNVNVTTSTTRAEKLAKVNIPKEEWSPLTVISSRGAIVDSNKLDLVEELSPRKGRLNDISCMIKHEGHQEFDLLITVGDLTGSITHRFIIRRGINQIERTQIDVEKGELVKVRIESNSPVSVEQIYFSAILEIKK